jgi:hypothetical protein
MGLEAARGWRRHVAWRHCCTEPEGFLMPSNVEAQLLGRRPTGDATVVGRCDGHGAVGRWCHHCRSGDGVLAYLGLRLATMLEPPRRPRSRPIQPRPPPSSRRCAGALTCVCCPASSSISTATQPDQPEPVLKHVVGRCSRGGGPHDELAGQHYDRFSAPTGCAKVGGTSDTNPPRESR